MEPEEYRKKLKKQRRKKDISEATYVMALLTFVYGLFVLGVELGGMF